MDTSEKYLITKANQMDSIGDKEGAVKYYKKALSENKKSVVALTNLATIYYELKDYKTSAKYCKKVLSVDSKNISALINLGNICYQKRDLRSALDYYKKARELKDNYYVAEVNLANTYLDLRDYNKAVEHALNASQLDSGSVTAFTIMGNSYIELNNNSKAIDALLKAKKLDPNDPWIDNSLSQAYQKEQQWDNAIDSAFNAVKISGGDDSQHINLGYLLYEFYLETGDKKAEKFAEKWLEKYPSNNIVLHMANSIKNKQKITRANDDYVSQIFDVFAPDFEDVLDALDYQVPKIISGFLNQISEHEKLKKIRILDAGCGTGLCGDFLKKYSCWRGLEGVDISGKMLDMARSKNIYSKLYKSELVEFLSTKKNDYNLIVSSDVFTYLGDLKELFKNIKKALKKNGRVVFSVSENALNEEGFFLDISGRFLHKKEYIKELLKEFDFEVEKFERHKLRNEGEHEVWGFVVSAKSL